MCREREEEADSRHLAAGPPRRGVVRETGVGVSTGPRGELASPWPPLSLAVSPSGPLHVCFLPPGCLLFVTAV